MSELLSPEWEKRTKERYELEKARDVRLASFGDTSFGRHEDLELIVRDVLKKGPSLQNILCVGVGRRIKCIQPAIIGKQEELLESHCGTYPFEISATAEGLEKDYEMTLIDIEEENLNLIKSTETFFVELETREGNRKISDSVRRYLQDTKQDMLDNYPVAIPRTFKEKAANGKIRFVQGDIVISDLSPYGPFDFANCLNVFMHLPFQYRGNPSTVFGKEILILALYNIIRSMKKDGIFVVDQKINDNTGLCVSTKYLIDRLFRERGMAKVEEIINIDSKADYLVARKL